jgi:hypothetical protein
MDAATPLVFKYIAVIDTGVLLTALTLGVKIITFLNDIKFKTEILWQDYESRVNDKMHYHKRSDDK